ncbi:MAG TPA: hypothetical protein K8V91_09825 [[Clostridium] spiroforme]|mgnify:CR=1 FL=1|uniref:Uncharacterized protein n=1 Tax=Thomasclavelia spiroformis TaxID=29348 RepID=A0A921GCL6_9FIRM|nr:hypothetical protein [Thomasclavelia spiroformis]
MKEATGELNMTVVTVVAIAAVAAFFYAFVWPSIQNSIENNTRCASAQNCQCDGDSCECTYYDDENKPQTITCPNNDTTGSKS